MKHFLHSDLASRQIKTLLVGAGGSGSRMLEALQCLHRALRAKGHPHGLDVTVVDPDTVSLANVGRQAFYPTDVGAYKAITLVNRANMALGDTRWKAVVGKVTTKTTGLHEFQLVIGAVDNRSARLGIIRSLERAGFGTRYYLDMGNRASDGQVILGEVQGSSSAKEDPDRLPHAGELFPDLIDVRLDKVEDDTPSCSLAEALERQSLFVNTAMALYAGNLLWQLFTEGEISNHGAFIDLKSSRTAPLEIDPETWARFGIVRQPPEPKKKRASGTRNRAAAAAA